LPDDINEMQERERDGGRKQVECRDIAYKSHIASSQIFSHSPPIDYLSTSTNSEIVNQSF